MVSVTAIWHHHYHVKTAPDNAELNVQGSILTQLYLQNQSVGWVFLLAIICWLWSKLFLIKEEKTLIPQTLTWKVLFWVVLNLRLCKKSDSAPTTTLRLTLTESPGQQCFCHLLGMEKREELNPGSRSFHLNLIHAMVTHFSLGSAGHRLTSNFKEGREGQCEYVYTGITRIWGGWIVIMTTREGETKIHKNAFYSIPSLTEGQLLISVPLSFCSHCIGKINQ